MWKQKLRKSTITDLQTSGLPPDHTPTILQALYVKLIYGVHACTQMQHITLKFLWVAGQLANHYLILSFSVQTCE